MDDGEGMLAPRYDAGMRAFGLTGIDGEGHLSGAADTTLEAEPTSDEHHLHHKAHHYGDNEHGHAHTAARSGKDGPATAEDPYEVNEEVMESLSTMCLTTCHTESHIEMMGRHTHWPALAPT